MNVSSTEKRTLRRANVRLPEKPQRHQWEREDAQSLKNIRGYHCVYIVTLERHRDDERSANDAGEGEQAQSEPTDAASIQGMRCKDRGDEKEH
jgi:hypothetical protein